MLVIHPETEWKPVAIALDKHANGLNSEYQGRRGQKKAGQISPWFFQF